MPDLVLKKIRYASTLSILFLGLSVSLPRFIEGGDGFVSATEAALLFLCLGFLSLVLALYNLVVTLKHYESLSTNSRSIAVLPSILIALVALFVGLSF